MDFASLTHASAAPLYACRRGFEEIDVCAKYKPSAGVLRGDLHVENAPEGISWSLSRGLSSGKGWGGKYYNAVFKVPRALGVLYAAFYICFMSASWELFFMLSSDDVAFMDTFAYSWLRYSKFIIDFIRQILTWKNKYSEKKKLAVKKYKQVMLMFSIQRLEPKLPTYC